MTVLTEVHVNIAGSTSINVMTGTAGAPLRGSRWDHTDGRISIIIDAAAASTPNGGPLLGGTYVIMNAQQYVYDAKLTKIMGTMYLFKK